ncbi:hypothetical protein Y032_0576g212 [Ancylostoma ceylanicum]|uniref:Uncharacterized protein n=1 Tax=Ancylostoma ceylanicum TaxID=53326 RepID=A0A016WN29_9BILA|nr:hypothetical protein Y032_0576g212 [Ancylostoma ceylanicum]
MLNIPEAWQHETASLDLKFLKYLFLDKGNKRITSTKNYIDRNYKRKKRMCQLSGNHKIRGQRGIGCCL